MIIKIIIAVLVSDCHIGHHSLKDQQSVLLEEIMPEQHNSSLV